MSQPNKQHEVLIDGQWIREESAPLFSSKDPNTAQAIEGSFPVSSWATCDRALASAHAAFRISRGLEPAKIAAFLEDYASRIQADAAGLVEIAHRETGLAKSPRLMDVELPRTVNQLRLAAKAAVDESWRMPVIDRTANIRSCYIALGPVAVFGPNNFPFAFNSISGGDFAAAIAAGNPVIAKANSSHPATTERLGRLVAESMQATHMPKGLVQLIYRTSHEDGERLVADLRLGAVGYTGARQAGLRLKAVADRVGKPFYAELSSVNPVVYLPGALQERGDKLIEEYVASGLMGTGQFCTNPGLLLMVASPEAESFIHGVVSKYQAAPAGTLLSEGVQTSLVKSLGILIQAGAECLTGGSKLPGNRCAVSNTVLRVTGKEFLKDPHVFQTEAFGNAVLITVCESVDQILQLIDSLEGNLTGSIYSDTQGKDDGVYAAVAQAMEHRVGRLLNDKMPTGVAVSPAMNHGGPYPATSHPGFTAVGIPASLLRFAKLTCYDAVRESRLPRVLRDKHEDKH
ncbi:MAG: aldehyde dehydrogenase (NADP(+)) [Pirellula sp.]|jgi:NADP-dependent aldehyde dehydrogenase|nr:aldehyde dehydrogenase (NADP(+)) [Pirellula sp.]